MIYLRVLGNCSCVALPTYIRVGVRALRGEHVVAFKITRQYCLKRSKNP